MINETSESKSARKNGNEKILYPMRHYAFGRCYNHAIRNVSDLESRYFVSSMRCVILQDLHKYLYKSCKGHLRDGI